MCSPQRLEGRSYARSTPGIQRHHVVHTLQNDKWNWIWYNHLIQAAHYCPTYHFQSPDSLWCLLFHMRLLSGLQRLFSALDLFVTLNPTFMERAVCPYTLKWNTLQYASCECFVHIVYLMKAARTSHGAPVSCRELAARCWGNMWSPDCTGHSAAESLKTKKNISVKCLNNHRMNSVAFHQLSQQVEVVT